MTYRQEDVLYDFLNSRFSIITGRTFDPLEYGKANFVLFAVLIVLCVVILANQIKINKQLRQLLKERPARQEPKKPESAGEP